MNLAKVNEPAPDFKLRSLEGEMVQLSRQKQPVALCFMRHLAWVLWADHLVQLHQPEVLAEFARVNARLLVISFASLARFEKWPDYWRTTFLEPALQDAGKTPHENPFKNTTFLHDPKLETYRAFGLGRFSVLQAYGPGILLKYAQLGLQGKPIKAPQEDTLQRGGDFVVDHKGIVTFAHSGRNQTERPPVRQIIKHLRLSQAKWA